jgi:hypothetical protein
LGEIAPKSIRQALRAPAPSGFLRTASCMTPERGLVETPACWMSDFDLGKLRCLLPGRC